MSSLEEQIHSSPSPTSSDDEKRSISSDMVNLDDQNNHIEQILTQIGFGNYHKKLLILCGLGWLADNLFLQGDPHPPPSIYFSSFLFFTL